MAAPFLALGLRAFGDQEEDPIVQSEPQLILEGHKTFRFDTFGDEGFWGDTLKLHQAIEGSALGGVGPGVSPAAALAVGLKMDADVLPQSLVADVRTGRVDLNSPATTLALLKLNALARISHRWSVRNAGKWGSLISSIQTAVWNRWEFSARFATQQ